MTTTMSLIAKQTVGANGASSITFSNIPQTYTDLKLVISARLTNTSYGETIRIKPNNSTANGFSRILRAYGTGVSSYRLNWITATNNALGNGATSGMFTSVDVYCKNYTSSEYKSFLAEGASPNAATDGRVELSSSFWSDTAPITSITLDNNAGTPFTFVEGSTFYLYGISSNVGTQATAVPYASGGDVITTDGTYWYHAFKSSGAFTPLKNLDADVLVVAGGGGGGAYVGGGGGAGGVSYQAGRALTSATNYICTVGAGGTAGAIIAGGNGGSSTFDTIVSNGGGGGSYNDTAAIYSGGSGGGATYRSGGLSGGAATQGNTGGATGYGFRGGNVVSGASAYAATGGGGSGGQGVDATSGSGGTAGGPGKDTWSTWLSATSLGVSGYIAGGGGGGGDASVGSGGSGGGGTGGLNSSSATAAVANTGSGGGGTRGYNIYYGGTGGSGLIIVRYAV